MARACIVNHTASVDVVAAFEQRLGRPIQIVSLSPGQPLPGLPEIVAGLMARLDTYDSVIEMGATAKTFGVQQTSVSQFLQGIQNVGSG